MINILLCDDNSETIKKYSHLIKKVAEKNHIEFTLSAFDSGEVLIFHISTAMDLPNIIYIDILMSGMNGIDTAKQIRELGCKAEIIFLTTSEEHVFDSFDVFPVNYLIKENTSEAKFEQVFMKTVNLINNVNNDKLICKSGAKVRVIPVSDIYYFDIWRGVVTVHYGQNEIFEYWMTMEELEDQLKEKSFIRIHRSYIVNLKYISKFQRRSILLNNNEIIPVGVTYANKVKTAFLDFISRHNTYI